MNRSGFTTNELASLVGNKPETIRQGHSRNGHYLGIVPGKTPSGRLIWPADQVTVLLGDTGAETAFEAITVLANRVAYCTTASERASMGRRLVFGAYQQAMDALLGAGQSLGFLPMDADASKVFDLMGVNHD